MFHHRTSQGTIQRAMMDMVNEALKFVVVTIERLGEDFVGRVGHDIRAQFVGIVGRKQKHSFGMVTIEHGMFDGFQGSDNAVSVVVIDHIRDVDQIVRTYIVRIDDIQFHVAHISSRARAHVTSI